MDYYDILLAKKLKGEGGGGDVTVQSLNVTANGTYTAPSNKAYSPVNVNVPNSYTSSDEGKVVDNGNLVSQTSQSISANGTYDTTLKNEVVVDVPSGWTTEGIANNTEPSGVLTIDATDIPSVEQNAFTRKSRITELNIIGTMYIKNYAFSYCTGITKIKAPSLTAIAQNASSTSQYVFQNCTSLAMAVFPSYGNKALDSYNFQNCTSLTVVDLNDCSKIGATFGGCTALRTLVIRRTSSVCALNQSGQNGVGGIYQNPNDSAIYVPTALISSYQSATNWSALYNLNNNIFKAIEGSIYETQYADGTPIGA